LAIKQQEQATLQALLSNPLRLKKMQEELGVKPKKDKERKKKEKEERKRLKQERKHHKHRDGAEDRLSRTPSPSRERMDRGRSPDNRDRSWSRSRSPRYRASRSPVSDRSRRFDHEARLLRRWSPEHYRGRSRSRSPRRDRDQDDHRNRTGSSRLNGYYGKRENSRRYDSPPHNDHHKRSLSPSPRQRSPPSKRPRYSPPPPPAVRTQNHSGSNNSYTQPDADRVARLAAMQSNATTMSEDRQKRLTALLEKEKAELEADERARERGKGVSSFLSQEQKRVFGGSGGLEDRIRRGKGGMVVDAD